jgi:glutathione S-transferase
MAESNLKLYGFPGGPMSRHHRCEWMLNELGADHEFIPVDFFAREHRSDEFRKLNPNGRLPILVDGDFVLWESTAICTYLGDKFPNKELVPRPGTHERGRYNQWMAFASGELDAQLMIIGKAMAEHYFSEIVPEVEVDEATRQTAAAAARAEFITFAGVVESHLLGRDFLLDSFSAADIVMWWVLNSANMQGMLGELPTLAAYVARLAQRSAFPK